MIDAIARGLAAHALSVAEAGGGDHPVETVNGKTGQVILGASDVGALSVNGGTVNGAIGSTAQPTDDSHLTRKDYVDNAVAGGCKFVVALTENVADNTYAADKSWGEIKAAYDANKVLAVRIGSAELPLMDADIQDTGAGLMFGYTNVSVDSSVVTRAVHYLHTTDADTWTDADETGEYTHSFRVDFTRDGDVISANATAEQIIEAADAGYIIYGVLLNEIFQFAYNQSNNVAFSNIYGSVLTTITYSSGAWTVSTKTLLTEDGGTVTGALMLADEPVEDSEAANKSYVDTCTSKCVQAVTVTAGQIKAYVQNGAKQDVCIVDSAGKASCIPRYTAYGQLFVNPTPTADGHATNKKYVDDKVATCLPLTGGTITGDLKVANAPTTDDGVANKGYVDASFTDVLRKGSVTVAANSNINVPMSNGVYLLTTSSAVHSGLVCASVYSNGENLNDLVTLVGWTCNKMPTDNRGVTLTNTTATAMTVYITSIGEGDYR